MGDQCGRSGYGDTRSDSCEDKGAANKGHGLVQRKIKECLEVHLFVDGNECKGGRAVFVGSCVDGGEDPMVGVFDGHADSKDGETYGVGINSSNFSKPYAV